MLWAGLVLASLLGGLVKGATGFGGALAMAPSFVLLIGPRNAPLLTVLIHALTCLQGMGDWRNSMRWTAVLPAAVTAVSFAALFAHLIGRADVASMRRVTGWVVLTFAVIQAFGWRFRHQGGFVPAFLCGLVSGATTAAAGTGGPPAVMYFSGGAGDEESRKESIRGNLSVYFALLYGFSALGAVVQGRVNAELAQQAVLAAPFFYVGGRAGDWLFLRVNHKQFDRIAAALLALSGAILLFR